MYTKLYCFILFCVFNFTYSQYITVDENYTAAQLVQDVLINSGCASISNVSVSGGNFSTGEKSWGYFSGNGSSFPFSEGLILSTGKINNAVGPNTFTSDDTASGWIGDNDLNTALNITNSINATILEFDFIPIGNQISFDYIFSSEEYHDDAPCLYSDGFAFLLKEVGSTAYENLALIPNTTIPVKVTTVHPAIFNGCPAQNAQYFDAFNGTEHPTNFNGQTVVLTARSPVSPGTPYHIKLVIADEGNFRYDSAIFIKGSSFSFGVDLGDDRTLVNDNPICFDENVSLDATAPGAQSYQWQFNSTPIAGAINPTFSLAPPYTTAQNGVYSVATTYSATCVTTSSIALNFSEELNIGQTSFSYCDNDGAQDGLRSVLLTDITTSLFPSLPTNAQVNYFSSISSNTPLSTFFLLTVPYQQTIYARINNNRCFNNIAVDLNILVFSDPVTDENIEICNDDAITLTADNGFQTYLWNNGAVSASIQVTTPGIYTVTIGNLNNCTKLKTFTVIGSEIATIEDIIVNDFSATTTAEIVATGNGIYQYSIDGQNYQDSPIFANLSELEYTAYVKDTKGCGIVDKKFYLLQIPKYFTPNGDGTNDTWTIRNLTRRGLNQTIITIFDRYGKMIEQFNGSQAAWDGTYNGKTLPADDYWFTFANNGRELFRGHLALLR
jgi:gliding motility-associated-like protein